MSTKGTEGRLPRFKDDDGMEIVDDATDESRIPSDLSRRQSSESADVFESGSKLAVSDVPMREALKQALHESRQRNLAEQVQREHAGEGLVAVNQRTGNVIAVAESMAEMSRELESVNVDPADRLLVRCYE